MKVEDIKKVAVLGAGDMGHGIAEVCAIAGYEVSMRDIKQEFVDRGIQRIKESLAKLEKKGRIKNAEEVLARIYPTVDLEEAVKDADLIIEAVPEVVEIKKQVFAECDKFAPEHTIFASNTSTIMITELAKATKRENKFVGLHFFNPPVLMRLVEVIRGEKTDEETMQACVEFVKTLGKTPIRVEKDVPGFIVNRIQASSGVLLMAIIEHEIATPEEVDAMIRRLVMPMGLFELMDFVGIDVFYHAIKYYEKVIGPDYRPPKILEKMVEEGRLGKKTGKGWYDWSAGRPKIDMSKSADKISPTDFMIVELNEAVKLVEMGVATPDDIDTAIKLGLNRPFGPFEFAKNLSEETIVKRLEELAKQFNKKIFEPAETLRKGKLKDMFANKKEEIEKKFKTIKVEKDPEAKIARLILNRPDRLNALSLELIDELDRAIDVLWKDKDIRVIVITGAGDKAFSVGADLSISIDHIFDFIELNRRCKRVFKKLIEIPKPVIAAINGYALGGGLELALSCDLRLAKKSAIIGLPEATLGLIPGWGGTQRLVKLIGISKAMELVLTGEKITAEEGAKFGLINRVFDDDKFEEEVTKFAERLAERCAPISMAIIKSLINKGGEIPTDIGLEMESLGASIVFSTEDSKEGISAFLRKEKPQFRGR